MGKGSPTTSNTQQNQNVSYAPAGLQNFQDIYNTANQAASTPYQPYGGQLTAGLNDTQLAGINNINMAQGAAAPAINHGGELIQRGAGMTSQGYDTAGQGAGYLGYGAGMVGQGANISQSGQDYLNAGAGMVGQGSNISQSGQNYLNQGANTIGQGTGIAQQ